MDVEKPEPSKLPDFPFKKEENSNYKPSYKLGLWKTLAIFVLGATVGVGAMLYKNHADYVFRVERESPSAYNVEVDTPFFYHFPIDNGWEPLRSLSLKDLLDPQAESGPFANVRDELKKWSGLYPDKPIKSLEIRIRTVEKSEKIDKDLGLENNSYFPF